MEITSVENILLLGLSTVAGVVVFLWRQLTTFVDTVRGEMNAHIARVEKDLEECREDREALWREIVGRPPKNPAG